VLTIRPNGSGDVTLQNLSFINGWVDDVQSGGAALAIDPFGSFAGDVIIENNAFVNNEARFGGALSASSGRLQRITNNLFVGNTARLDSGAASLVNSSGNGIYLINNTVTGNRSQASGNGVVGGISVFVANGAEAFTTNNILWDNDLNDLATLGDGFHHGYNNDIEQSIGGFDAAGNNVSVDPLFQSGFLNFQLRSQSPLIDAGLNDPLFIPVPSPFDLNWQLPELDLLGNDREMGDRVDIGAFEALPSLIFSDGFE